MQLVTADHVCRECGWRYGQHGPEKLCPDQTRQDDPQMWLKTVFHPSGVYVDLDSETVNGKYVWGDETKPEPADYELRSDDFFGTREFWESRGGKLKPGAQPWVAASGKKLPYFNQKDVVGGDIYGSVMPRAIKDWLQRGYATKCPGWGTFAGGSALTAQGIINKELAILALPPGEYKAMFGSTDFDEKGRLQVTAIAHESTLVEAEDPSARRDREHKAVKLPARTPFDHFPDLAGWTISGGGAAKIFEGFVSHGQGERKVKLFDRD